jgi:ATP-dependent DNA helicase RecQ
MLKVLDVDGAVSRVEGGWMPTGVQWEYDADRYERIAAARGAEQQAMRDYIATERCRLQFLREQLDDPDAGPCGRCDNCTGVPLTAMVAETAVTAVRTRMDAAGIELPAHTRWPSGLDQIDETIKGAIAEADRVATGRAIGRLTDIAWGPRLRELLRETAPDDVITAELFTAATRVLRDWPWEIRPSAVMIVPSRTRPILIRSIGEQLAAIGRLEFLGSLEIVADTPQGVARSNSAHRVRALHEAFRATPEQREALERLGNPAVLLVDDQVDSGWTITMAGRELRRAGAGAVLPFALAKVR